MTCLPAAAGRVSDDAANPMRLPASTATEGPGLTPHPATRELQMFADVFNQIRQGYVESVPTANCLSWPSRHALGLDPHSVFLKEKALIHCRKRRRASSVDWV